MEFQFANLSEFLTMGGHGIFVWVSYLMTFLALVGMAIYPRIARRRLQSELLRQQKNAQRRRRAVSERTATKAPDLAKEPA
ncbi:heme exporter protein CcmD [Microbulbifer sp. OS29]|uniref:Heme exporter protein D n=1 Tax=Microbulbifer okhotskensis TaxID=2926617 RepID=A0A9X2J7I5_9GAMM|nr:heme exporter protein CcmD [Microbulbifer okhotskensis]MCO1334516.1 heme exporter protein CcmD [Microbulbifer okhotskensis]